MKYIYKLICITGLISINSNKCLEITLDTTNILNDKISFNIKLGKSEYLYKDYINFTIDNPDITISNWQPNINYIEKYDPNFQEKKKIFDKDFTISLDFTKKNNVKDAKIHFSYYLNTDPNYNEKIFPLKFVSNKQPNTQLKVKQTIEKKSNRYTKKNVNIFSKFMSSIINFFAKIISSWQKRISHLINATSSGFIQAFFIFLLGILLSLTPCIYPMITITLGILQTQGTSSILKNFLIAFSYTLGIATTFAILGLVAAFSGEVFGNLMGNPIIIIGLVIFFIYLALSMFGLYDLYIPTFLSAKKTNVKGGSILSAFIFGAISGTIASPCVSPGLALVLGIVASIGSKLIGFIYLFLFGLGLSTPLLIIGTFSSSINMLPRAGTWMIEIKKIFGFLLFAMCFHLLSNITPNYILSWIIAIFVTISGLYYLQSIKETDSKIWKNIKNIIGISLIAISILLFSKSYKITYLQTKKEKGENIWKTDYELALKNAKINNKKLLLDFWGKGCAICKIINKNLLENKKILPTLKKLEPVKIEGTKSTNKKYLKQYKILGYPTLILIDKDEKIIKQWSGELYKMQTNQFIQEIQKYL